MYSNEEFEYNDFSIGVDLGSRWKWYFNKGFGMSLQVYAGAERFVTNKEITDTFYGLPFIYVYGFQIGLFF